MRTFNMYVATVAKHKIAIKVCRLTKRLKKTAHGGSGWKLKIRITIVSNFITTQ